MCHGTLVSFHTFSKSRLKTRGTQLYSPEVIAFQTDLQRPSLMITIVPRRPCVPSQHTTLTWMGPKEPSVLKWRWPSVLLNNIRKETDEGADFTTWQTLSDAFTSFQSLLTSGFGWTEAEPTSRQFHYFPSTANEDSLSSRPQCNTHGPFVPLSPPEVHNGSVIAYLGAI